MPTRTGPGATLVGAFGLLRAAARRTAGLSVALDIIGAIAGAALLGIAGRLLGLLAEGTSWSEVLPWVIGATVALTLTMVTTSIHHDLTRLAAEQVEAHAVGRVLESASRVPFISFDSPDFYDGLRRAHESGKLHAWSIVQATLSLVRSLLELAAIVVLLVVVAPILIAVAVGAFVPLWIVGMLNTRLLYKFTWDETEDDRRRSYIEQLLGDRRPAKEIRVFGLEDQLVGQFRRLWKARLDRLGSIVSAIAVRTAIGSLLSSVVVGAALGFVVWLTVQGDLTLDEAGIGVIGVRQLSNGVTRTSQNVEAIHRSSQFLQDFETFDRQANELASQQLPIADLPLISSVEVEDLSFSYSGSATPALAGVNMTFATGQISAVVGSNGSGKTTLLLLLAGLYEPTHGRIGWRVDSDAGEQIETTLAVNRQRSAAPLFQDFIQFHFSARENVVLGAHDQDRLEWALELASAAEFVNRLDRGLETQLGRDFAAGSELSIGQWQRLALARAVYSRAPIILLDEPASALDPSAEAALVDNLRASCADRCVVMISHRFASVRKADVIYVLDEGKVIEAGAHAELMAMRGAYHALYSTQTGHLGD